VSLEREAALRARLLCFGRFRLYLLRHLPLAFFAGLRLEALGADSCTVGLPGGWRTRNPFRSTYFAAQAMAAEMSTGAPALLVARSQEAPVSMLVREVRGLFLKKSTGRCLFTFGEVAALRAAVQRVGAGGEGEAFAARSIGRAADGAVVAEFEIVWSFKRRA
jgi:hypothetical protein